MGPAPVRRLKSNCAAAPQLCQSSLGELRAAHGAATTSEEEHCHLRHAALGLLGHCKLLAKTSSLCLHTSNSTQSVAAHALASAGWRPSLTALEARLDPIAGSSLSHSGPSNQDIRSHGIKGRGGWLFQAAQVVNAPCGKY